MAVGLDPRPSYANANYHTLQHNEVIRHAGAVRGVSFTWRRPSGSRSSARTAAGRLHFCASFCGEEAADSGSVHVEQGVTLGYLPQEVDLPEVAGLHLAVMGVNPALLACASEMQILEKEMASATGEQAHALGAQYAEVSHRFDGLHGFDYSQRAKTILLGLGFEGVGVRKARAHAQRRPEDARRACPTACFSRRMCCCSMSPPTTSIFARATGCQEFLKSRYNGAAVIVSHDRYFLDGIVTRVLEIEGRTRCRSIRATTRSSPGSRLQRSRSSARSTRSSRRRSSASRRRSRRCLVTASSAGATARSSNSSESSA